MTIFLDTSAVGGPGPITGSGQVFTFGGVETPFYVGAVSNIIPGQSTGPSVQFVIQSRTEGQSTFQVDYATQFPPRKFSGHLLSAIVPSGTVSVRIVIADNPQQVVASLVGTATSSGATAAFYNGTIAAGGTATKYFPPTGVPAGYVGRLHSMYLTGTSGQTFTVVQQSSGGYSVDDFGGTLTFAASGVWQAQERSTALVVLYGKTIGPGDSIIVTNLSAADTIGYNVFLTLEPL